MEYKNLHIVKWGLVKFFPINQARRVFHVFETISLRPSLWIKLNLYRSFVLFFVCAFWEKVAIFFVRPQSSPCMYRFFVTWVNRFSGNPTVAGSSPCFSLKLFPAFAKPQETKGSLLSIFRLCETFSENFSMSPSDPIFNFSDIFQQIEFSKSPKGPPFRNFRHCEIFQNDHFRLKIRFSQWTSTLYPNFVFFWDRRFSVLRDFFPICYCRSSLNFYQKRNILRA